MDKAYTVDSANRFTLEQLDELRTSLEIAVIDRSLPRLPEWYCNLPIIERGLALILTKNSFR